MYKKVTQEPQKRCITTDTGTLYFRKDNRGFVEVSLQGFERDRTSNSAATLAVDTVVSEIKSAMAAKRHWYSLRRV